MLSYTWILVELFIIIIIVIDMIPFFSVFHDARSVILQLQKYMEDKTIFRSGSRRLVK